MVRLTSPAHTWGDIEPSGGEIKAGGSQSSLLCRVFYEGTLSWLCAQGGSQQERREPCTESCDLATLSSITRPRALLPLRALLF